MRDTVDVPCGNQTRIMHLGSRNRMPQHQPQPFGVNEFVFGQQGERAVDSLGAFIRLLRQEAVSVPVGWSSADIPELNDVLGDVTESFAPRLEGVDSPPNQRVLRVVRFDEAQQDVCISQVQ